MNAHQRRTFLRMKDRGIHPPRVPRHRRPKWKFYRVRYGFGIGPPYGTIRIND